MQVFLMQNGVLKKSKQRFNCFHEFSSNLCQSIQNDEVFGEDRTT